MSPMDDLRILTYACSFGQVRSQSMTLLSLEAVDVFSGSTLRVEYTRALQAAHLQRLQHNGASEDASACEAEYSLLDGKSLASTCSSAADASEARAAPDCSHCAQWAERPLFRGFSTDADAMPEVHLHLG